MLDIIISFIIMIVLGIFAVAACWLSSGQPKDYEEESVKNGRKTKE